MFSKTFVDLIKAGETIRETGNPRGSLVVFQEAFDAAKTSSEISEALRHTGLAYEHLGELANADESYNNALSAATLVNDVVGRARCLRHMASISLKQGEFSTAKKLSVDALNLINSLECSPSDKVWFTHGITKIFIQSGEPKDQIRMWTKVEFFDLVYSLKNEKSRIPRNVWLTGWMMDAAFAWFPWALPLVPIAYLITVFNGLKLRKNQIKKAIC